MSTTVSWQEQHSISSGGANADVGLSASGWVAVTYQADSGSSDLHYRLGQVSTSDSDSVTWYSHHDYASSSVGRPSIAINSNNVVVGIFPSSGAISPSLHTHVGTINTGSQDISNFSGSADKSDDGYQPSIAINDDGVVIEVHVSYYWGRLWYRVGVIGSDNKSITYGPPAHVTHNDNKIYGQNPSVALSNTGRVSVVFNGGLNQSDADTVYSLTGSINASKNAVLWNSAEVSITSSGQSPICAVDGSNNSIEVHQHSSDWKYATGFIGGAPSWGGTHDQGSGKMPAVDCDPSGNLIQVEGTSGLNYHRGVMTTS